MSSRYPSIEERMSDRIEVTEAMIAAAMATGKNSGALTQDARQADVRRLLSAALNAMVTSQRGARYDLWVCTGIEKKRARFVSVTERRGYYRVETEEGKALTVCYNDIQPNAGIAA